MAGPAAPRLAVLDTFPGLSAEDSSTLQATALLAQAQGFDWRTYYTNATAQPSFMTDAVPFARGWTLTEVPSCAGAAAAAGAAHRRARRPTPPSACAPRPFAAAWCEQRNGMEGRRGDVAAVRRAGGCGLLAH